MLTRLSYRKNTRSDIAPPQEWPPVTNYYHCKKFYCTGPWGGTMSLLLFFRVDTLVNIDKIIREKLVLSEAALLGGISVQKSKLIFEAAKVFDGDQFGIHLMNPDWRFQ
jgi:hypothetical protein